MWRHEEDSNIQWYMCKQPPPPQPTHSSFKIPPDSSVSSFFSVCENILTPRFFSSFLPTFVFLGDSLLTCRLAGVQLLPK